MQRTPEQLREAAASPRATALASPTGEIQRQELAEAERLEQLAAELETNFAAEEAKRLRQQLNLKDMEVQRLTKRVTWLEAIIAHQIGQPVEGLTDAKLAFKLDDVKDQRNKLAAAIGAATSMEGLNKAKDIARNMGLISGRAQHERITAGMGQG